MVGFCLNFEEKQSNPKQNPAGKNPKNSKSKKIRILRNSPHETLQKNTPKIGLCSNFKQNHGLKQSFFKKTKYWSFFECERFENKKKGLLLMKKATKKRNQNFKIGEC